MSQLFSPIKLANLELPNRIVILRAMESEPTPYFVGVLRGVETGQRIQGYDPADRSRSIDAILQLDPIGTKPVAPQSPLRGTLSDDEPPPARVIREVRRAESPARTTDAYTPHWTWPGDLKAHLVRSHGYSRAWLDRLTIDQLEALHDADHDSGS